MWAGRTIRKYEGESYLAMLGNPKRNKIEKNI